MTDCNRDPLHFSRLGPKAVVADFRGGRLTTDAGALLLREVADRLGLFDALDAAIPDPRQPRLIVHDQKAMLAQRVTAIALGYEDLNDHQALRADPALQARRRAGPRRRSRPSPRRRPSAAWRTASTARPWSASPRSWSTSSSPPTPSRPRHLILDFDATDDPVHGKQEGRFFHGYYDHHCFLPLYVFCGDELLAAYLRPSNIDARQAHPRRPQAAGPAAPRRLAGGEDHDPGRQRVLPLAADALVRLATASATSSAWPRTRRWSAPRGTRSSGPSGSSAARASRNASSARSRYAAGSWDRPRRVIVKAEHTAQGPNPRFVVANVPGDPQELYEDVYCQRGEMENRIKEQQLDLFADRTSCHRFAGEPVPAAAELGGLRAGAGVAADGVGGDGAGAGAGGDDPAEVVQGGGAGGGHGASGGVPPGEQLPVPGGVPGGLRAHDGPPDRTGCGDRVWSAPEIGVRVRPSGWGSGGRCASKARRCGSPGSHAATNTNALLAERRMKHPGEAALDRRQDLRPVQPPDRLRGPHPDPVQQQHVGGIGRPVAGDDVQVRQHPEARLGRRTGSGRYSSARPRHHAPRALTRTYFSPS